MPLYEFYCQPCHTIFTFRSHRVDTATVPECPRCGAKLTREVSAFSHSIAGKSDTSGTDADELANAREEDLIAKMSDRMDQMAFDEDDPASAVRAMREMARAGGLSFNKDVEEAFARIEAGEDPEKVDETFQDLFENTHNPFAEEEGTSLSGKVSDLWRRMRPPARDKTWYDL
ncbi:MAG: zinc ribbon domain-containing protein [Kiritimatiellae bacterium]|nr:zinc ribbon domain-containing protein [Kiritimatiellia bacterium]